jgi:two-component system response regulator DesR
LVRGALAAVLSQAEDITVVAELSESDHVLPVAEEIRPDVAVLDGALPGTLGICDLWRRWHSQFPDRAMLVMLDLPAKMALGADLTRMAPRIGLIATEASPDDLVDGVRRLARGEPVLDTDVAFAALTGHDNPLTDRERQVLRLVLDGAPAKEIATKLFLSTGTVRNYLARIVTKTGARTRIDAVRIAQHSGWI